MIDVSKNNYSRLKLICAFRDLKWLSRTLSLSMLHNKKNTNDTVFGVLRMADSVINDHAMQEFPTKL